MTVAELIRILETHPPDMPVMVEGYEDGFDELEPSLIAVKEMRLDCGEEWWEGRHRESEDTRREGSGIVNALALQRPWRSD